VTIVRTDVSEEHIASIIRVKRISPSWLIVFTLMMEAIGFSETPVLTRATRRHITEAGILHNRRYEKPILYWQRI
jgi:hypothetical protein